MTCIPTYQIRWCKSAAPSGSRCDLDVLWVLLLQLVAASFCCCSWPWSEPWASLCSSQSCCATLYTRVDLSSAGIPGRAVSRGHASTPASRLCDQTTELYDESSLPTTLCVWNRYRHLSLRAHGTAKLLRVPSKQLPENRLVDQGAPPSGNYSSRAAAPSSACGSLLHTRLV